MNRASRCTTAKKVILWFFVGGAGWHMTRFGTVVACGLLLAGCSWLSTNGEAPLNFVSGTTSLRIASDPPSLGSKATDGAVCHEPCSLTVKVALNGSPQVLRVQVLPHERVAEPPQRSDENVGTSGTAPAVKPAESAPVVIERSITVAVSKPKFQDSSTTGNGKPPPNPPIKPPPMPPIIRCDVANHQTCTQGQ